MFNFFSALSLLLLVAAAMPWVRSYFEADLVRYKAGSGERRLYGMILRSGAVRPGHT
jgi:hypothetical protein